MQQQQQLVASSSSDVPDGAPGSDTWKRTPWSSDRWAQRFVEDHPRGATTREIAEAMGVSVATVDRDLASALRKLGRD